MASPQVEDGFAKVARELLKAIARARLSPAERACVDCVIDATYGWNRKWASISRQDFIEYTGYSYRQLKRALVRLRERDIIEAQTDARPIRYRVQKDYERWPPQGDNPDPPAGPSDAPPLQEATSTDLRSAGRVANAIVGVVTELGLDGVRPANWPKQHKAALRLVAQGETEESARLACLGLQKLFPYSGGMPFDVFDLERLWSKAAAIQKDETPKRPCSKCGLSFPETRLLYTADGFFRYCTKCSKTFTDAHRLLRHDERRAGRGNPEKEKPEREGVLDRVSVPPELIN